MGKQFLVLPLSLILVLVTGACNMMCFHNKDKGFLEICGNDRGGKYITSNELVSYSMTKEEYCAFINDPSSYIQNISSETSEMSVIRKYPEKKEPFELNIYKGESQETITAPDAILRINYIPVSLDFFDFTTNKRNIEKLLEDRQVYSEVTYYALISCDVHEAYAMPVFIFAKTNHDNYFITIDKSGINNEYNYHVHTQKEFVEKFGSKEGNLEVNGKYIDSIEFINEGATLPFVQVMEALGTGVFWDKKINSITFFDDLGREYTFYPGNALSKRVSVVENGEKRDVGMCNEWFNFSYKICDDDIEMNNMVLSGFLRLVGARMEINKTDLTVKIIG